MIDEELAAAVRVYQARVAAYNAERESDRILMAAGADAVPGLRLGDCRQAGVNKGLLDMGLITQEEWDAYVAELHASNKVYTPKDGAK